MLKITKRYYSATKYSQKQELPKEGEIPLSWRRIFYKSYSRLASKKLSPTEPEKDFSLEGIMHQRETTRKFSENPLSFANVSNLLVHSAGISLFYKAREKRVYPSAGARYPIEMYFVSNNIEELDKGIYHYNIKRNSVERLLESVKCEQIKEIIIQPDLRIPPALFILTAVLSRSDIKYGENAYRFALIESGHIGQNIYLLCEKYGLGCCAIGGFDNDILSKIIDLTEEEIPLYLIGVGNKP